jgi:hypothetical protein
VSALGCGRANIFDFIAKAFDMLGNGLAKRDGSVVAGKNDALGISHDRLFWFG